MSINEELNSKCFFLCMYLLVINSPQEVNVFLFVSSYSSCVDFYFLAILCTFSTECKLCLLKKNFFNETGVSGEERESSCR